MDYKNSYDGIDKYAADLIRHKARQIIGKAGLTQSDRPDIEQELMLDLLHRMRHFNPAKGKKTTFMARIVERHIATILEARHAKCRDWRKCKTSLNEPVTSADDNSTERIDLVGNDGLLGQQSINIREEQINDLRIDIDRVIDMLPDDLKDLCKKLQTSTMTEIAKEMGVPRSTLYEKLTKIRDAFSDAGLDEYI